MTVVYHGKVERNQPHAERGRCQQDARKCSLDPFITNSLLQEQILSYDTSEPMTSISLFIGGGLLPSSWPFYIGNSIFSAGTLGYKVYVTHSTPHL